MDLQLILAAIAFAVFLSAFFSASETSLLRLKPDEVERDIKKKARPGEVAARELIRSSSRLLVTILIGNNIVNTFTAAAFSALAMHYFSAEAALGVATAVATLVTLIFGEILPKAMAASSPKKVGYAVALPLYLVHKLSWPLHLIFEKFVDPMIHKIMGKREEELGSAEAILRLAREIKRHPGSGGPLSIIGSAAKAAELHVEDIMIPRAEITAYSVETPAKEILEKMLADRFTRVPVYEGSLEKVLGLVHFKDLVAIVHAGNNDVRSIIKPLMRVPGRMPILTLLADMQKAFNQMAVVKDEFGVTLGVVTQEDILEEIVGEIRDEFDGEELMQILKITDQTYDVLGRVLVHDFNRETGWELHAERGDTLSGVVFNRLGRTPKKGDSVIIGAYELQVGDVSGARIIRVRVTRKHPAAPH
ncbi:MAG: HlyC/CorC family transporter [Bdellovibrionales bacterium]|nr:HlyC/CorC family transporter [Bdellovibrionales bacterium]